MAKIAVDIDDTLYSFTDLARSVIAGLAASDDDSYMMRAAYASWDEWRAPSDLMGLEAWLDIIENCHTDEMILSRIPFDGVLRVLDRLRNAGHSFVFISNRRESAKAATQQWLNYYDLAGPMDDVVCTTGDKRPHIAHCQYIIDDRPKTLVEFVYDYHWRFKHGSAGKERLGFALQRPYNSQFTDVPGILIAPTWELLGRFLEKKGVLPETVSYAA